MKLPKFIEPQPLRQKPLTEPGQALSLKDVVYRVSRGETTGIGSIPLEYGEDDGVDDPYLNGMEAELLDVVDLSNHLESTRKKVDNRLKFLKAKGTRTVKKKDDEPNPTA